MVGASISQVLCESDEVNGAESVHVSSGNIVEDVAVKKLDNATAEPRVKGRHSFKSSSARQYSWAFQSKELERVEIKTGGGALVVQLRRFALLWRASLLAAAPCTGCLTRKSASMRAFFMKSEKRHLIDW